MSQTKTPLTPEETRAISRLRAFGQGVKVFCLERGQTYCVPGASGNGSAYQVQISGETMLCSCPAGEHDRYCKHVAAVEMYRESQALLDNARSLVLITGLERSLEDKLADLY